MGERGRRPAGAAGAAAAEMAGFQSIPMVLGRPDNLTAFDDVDGDPRLSCAAPAMHDASSARVLAVPNTRAALVGCMALALPAVSARLSGGCTAQPN